MILSAPYSANEPEVEIGNNGMKGTEMLLHADFIHRSGI